MQFPENVTRLCGAKKFSFGCHAGVDCFTECCRELELALTPYDVLRLRRKLALGSADFINRFIVMEQEQDDVFPRFYLGMVDDGRASCPFVSPVGCMVYDDRPGACRAYPVGRGATLNPDGRQQEIYVLVKENHCLGFGEPQSYSVKEWFFNQGLAEYNQMNDEVMSLLQHDQVRQGGSFSPEQIDFFLLALYKLDEFREFVSGSDFQTQFNMAENERQAALTSEESLLKFGIHWLKNVLFEDGSWR
jgi:Fe-S-cluster containining protein